MKIYLSMSGDEYNPTIRRAFRHETDAQSYGLGEWVESVELEDGPVEVRTLYVAQAQFGMQDEVLIKTWDYEADYDPAARAQIIRDRIRLGIRITVMSFHEAEAIGTLSKVIQEEGKEGS